MIQFLNTWLDPTHVLTVSKPYYAPYIDGTVIIIDVGFMFRDKPVTFCKKLQNRVNFPTIAVGNAVNREEHNILVDKWRDALSDDFRLQAAEFEHSHEYTTFLKQIDDAKKI